ncbi:MAG: radical SAM protein [Deltaproteobacteria bacterium]|nr:radical SAM protein [Deltaproteobacteria bacterium]
MKNALSDPEILAFTRLIEEREDLKVTHPLRYLFWEATLRCNLECRHCGSDCTRDNQSKPREISSELMKKELVDISKHYPADQITFVIIGGEPLVREDIIDVGAFSAELGYYWGITTNGMLLDRKNVSALKEAKLKTISVHQGRALGSLSCCRCLGLHCRTIECLNLRLPQP